MDADDRTGQREAAREPGFFRRYRLPIALAIVAFCLYVGSIVYMAFVRGQIGA